MDGRRTCGTHTRSRPPSSKIKTDITFQFAINKYLLFAHRHHSALSPDIRNEGRSVAEREKKLLSKRLWHAENRRRPLYR